MKKVLDKAVREAIRVSNILTVEYNRIIEITWDNYQYIDLEVWNVFHRGVLLTVLKSAYGFNIYRIWDYIINQ